MNIKLVVTCENCFDSQTMTRTVMTEESTSPHEEELLLRCPECKHEVLVSIEVNPLPSELKNDNKPR